MIKKLIAILLLFWSFVQADPCLESERLVLANTRIHLDDYPGAFNPSLIQFNKGFLLTFRYIPDHTQGWVSYIGVVPLNEALQPISAPQLLETHTIRAKHPRNPRMPECFPLKAISI